MAVEQDLLRLPRRVRSGIDALAEAQDRTLGAQSPAPAIRQQQLHGIALGLQRRLDRGMEVEAHNEAAAGPAGQRILAAQVVAVGGEEKLAPCIKPKFAW